MNIIKIIGAAAIVGASSWTGFSAALWVRRRAGQLEQLKLSLELMRCEISYNHTPLAKLCGILAGSTKGEVRSLYRLLATQLEAPDAIPKQAVEKAAAELRGLALPQRSYDRLCALIDGFGLYNTAGQLRQIDLAVRTVETELEELNAQKANRCRSYEILGTCTGLALMILVV